MLQLITHFYTTLQLPQEYSKILAEITLVLGIIIFAWLVNFVAKTYIMHIVRKAMTKTRSRWGKILIKFNVFQRLSHLSPALAIYLLIPLIADGSYKWMDTLIHVIRTASMVYIVLAAIWFFMSLTNAFHAYYQLKKTPQQPSIKGYLQLARILLWAVAAILIIAIVLNKSPWLFFTGLGAASAILMLVFKDTILGFVASVQVSTYDMVRVGDWISMPSYQADGDVIDVSINTVKIRNFDQTITTVPTYSLISSGVQNWRGMQEKGGRRIKRAINLDIDTIKFCGDNLLKKLSKLQYLKTYIEQKKVEIDKSNLDRKIDCSTPVNGRSLTNIGLFRAYIDNYLRNNPNISQELTFLIRQLQPTQYGLPLEIYIFTNDTNWVRYENIQSDIFDHLFAALHLFELKAFQIMSGTLKN